jgi:hypothetical protein
MLRPWLGSSSPRVLLSYLDYIIDLRCLFLSVLPVKLFH